MNNFSINHELGLPFLKPLFDRCFQRLPHTTLVTSFFLQCKNNHLFFHFWAHFLLFLALLIIITMMTIHVNNSVHFHHYMSFISLCFSYGLLWRRQWHPTPALLPGKPHGWRSLVGYSPWDLKELNTTERLHFLSFFSISTMGTIEYHV